MMVLQQKALKLDYGLLQGLCIIECLCLITDQHQSIG